MSDVIYLDDNLKYRYELQLRYIIQGALFLDRLLPKWYLKVDNQILGTFLPGTSLQEQIEKYIVFPKLQVEERIQLGFLPLPEFMVNNAMEAIWSVVIFCKRRDLLKGEDTIELPAIEVKRNVD